MVTRPVTFYHTLASIICCPLCQQGSHKHERWEIEAKHIRCNNKGEKRIKLSTSVVLS